MTKRKLGIIGAGHVGSAMIELFKEHAEVITYDSRLDKSYPEFQLAKCDAGIICVDTPTGLRGECDVSHVRDAVERLPIDRVLIKSTVAPGTTDELSEETGKQICFSPEYFGESPFNEAYWTSGSKDVPFVILGGTPSVRRFFIDLLSPVLGPGKTYFQCSAREAEIIKYMENAYLATKVCFANEFRRICDAFDADWHTVREGWLLDPRIEPSHTLAFADSPGFSGKCLPKDLHAIVRACADAGYDATLLAEVLRSNERFREPLELQASGAWGATADGTPIDVDASTSDLAQQLG
jgi:nucleotide sugar dehydrogenase